MVYMQFPPNLTEEELMLQAKYAKLKKKKKALQAHKAPKQESQPMPAKRPEAARDAREVARKLLKSGAISAIQKPQKQEQTSFKRPKGQERKKVQPEVTANPAYQPFSSTQVEPESPVKEAKEEPKGDTRYPNLYQQFASERDKEERGQKANPENREKRVGNTIYVSGNKVTEEYLRKHFSDFGQILNVSMEIEKHRGFITFNKPEVAETAINDMHGKVIGGIQLQVQLARRQPQIEPINDASSSSVWSTLASSHSQKGNHKADKRELISYKEMDFF